MIRATSVPLTFVFPSKNKLLLDKRRLCMHACYAELLSAKVA